MSEIQEAGHSFQGPPDSLLRLVADSVPALMAYYDVATEHCRFANQRYAEYNGWTPQSILGKPLEEVIGKAAYAEIKPRVDEVLAGRTVRYVREQVLPSGERRMIEVSLLPHFPEGEGQIGVFVLINDITDQWLAEQAIRDSETRMRKFAQATHEGILFHKAGVMTDVNEGLLNLTGYTADEMVGRQTIDFVPEAWKQTVIDYIQAGKETPYEAEVQHKSGHTIAVEMVGKTMPFRGETYRLSVVRDISARKQAQARIEFLAWHDPLTELPNRLYLAEYLPRTLATARRQKKAVAVLFLDLDGFKTINDTQGHLAGDVLLREVASRIRAMVRESDLVARLGGDEFLIILNDIDGPEDVARVAHGVVQAMKDEFRVQEQAVTVTPSIGISLFPDHGETADELINQADAAMYLAKASGGNQYQLVPPDSTR